MNLRCLLLAGIWLGPVKPDMSIILRPVLERIHELYENGITFQTISGTRTIVANFL